MRPFAAGVVVALMLAPSVAFGAPTSKYASARPPVPFRVTSATEVPGDTLQSGSYSIQVVDHLKDRTVLQIKGRGAAPLLILAVAATQMPSEAGPVLWSKGQNSHAAMRGFNLPDGTSVEFVYPKADAVSIAKANRAEVAAIDPMSEGRPAKNLGRTDLQMVSLWMLTPTKVGPNDEPGLDAKKYEVPPSAGASSVQEARNTPVPRPRHVIATLPHTASHLPIIWLIGMVSFCGAVALRIQRLHAAA